MILIDAGTEPTHPTGPAGPGPSGPAGPRPDGPPPPKATGPTAPDPQGPPPPPPGPPTATFPPTDPPGGPDPRPNPFPPPPKTHIVDHGWKIELFSRGCDLLAHAEMRDRGMWRFQQTGHAARFVGGREQAEDAIRELGAVA